MSRFFYLRMVKWVVGLSLTGLVGLPLQAQPKGRVSPNLQEPGQLEQEEGRRVFAAFREQGIAGAHLLEFRFRHLPRRGEEISFPGELASDWDRPVPVLRVTLTDPRDERRWTFLIRSGAEPEVWRGAGGISEATELVQLDATAMVEPLLPGICVRPMDLALPFLYWEDVLYEGTRRVRGRPVHTYNLSPPVGDPRYAEIGSVAVALDADFLALLEVHYYDPAGRPLRSLKVGGFRKVEDLWMFSWIDLIDERARDKTRFEVGEVRLHTRLSEELLRSPGVP